MPELSRFFGIVIRMYFEVGERHHLAHFHAYYQGGSAIFRIDPIEPISGSLPMTQVRLVEAWAELHQTELLTAWNGLQSGKRPVSIVPLR